MKTLTSVLIVAFLFLFGCENNDGISRGEYEKLKAENKELKAALEDCRQGPKKRFNQAKSLFEKKNYDQCKAELVMLIDKYPGTSEAVQAKELLDATEKALQKIAAEKERVEKEKAEKEAQRLANATNKMRKKYDDIKGITWYRDKTSPRYLNTRTDFGAYIGKEKDGAPWLRLKIRYVADEWLFIEKYIIKADDHVYEITESRYGEIETDHGGGKIWEWLDRYVGPHEYSIIKAVADAKDAKIRFVGGQYDKDRVITTREKQALKNILNAYEALGGSDI
ncbi:hypothetical protein CR164_08485 [Prosthecochloris marina]|uniref:Uncharacterized protein n=1 Tax=Prosthecochloris marina TaxID=2017681 RepID=A0A317T5M3_9CHLB|nr:hypothetical protein [Prosthecochloris marina]PWW81845.1 hypothetical protein CR164_08485 [Prosthecochloris marina]